MCELTHAMAGERYAMCESTLKNHFIRCRIDESQATKESVVEFQQIKCYWKGKVASDSPPVYSLRRNRAYDELQKSLQPKSGKLDTTDR